MKAMKFRVESPEHSKQIQERLFEMGYKWMVSTVPKIEDRSFAFLFTNEQGFITHQSDINWFNKRPNIETTLSDIMPWQPKQGEIIEVEFGDKKWYEKEFLLMHNGKYLCVINDGYHTFKNARQINPIRKEIEALKDRIKELEGRL